MMTGRDSDVRRKPGPRRIVPSVVTLSLCALAVMACGNAVTLDFDNECIALEDIAAVDPPGVGGYNDVFVTTGLDSPLLCGDIELGELEFDFDPDEDIEVLEPLGDIRRRYAIGGPSAGTDEAFFERAGQPGNEIALPLLGLKPSDGVWQFKAPGVPLPIQNLRGDVISFRKGDRPEGYTTELQFSLLLDSRVRIVQVAFWRLVRESDGEGANVSREIVASWFGEQNVRVLDRISGGMAGAQYWQVRLEDYPRPSQIIDPVFAQCDIDGRLQFRLVSYMDVVVDDRRVDYFDRGGEDDECGYKWAYVSELMDAGFYNEEAINVYLPRSYNITGPQCGGFEIAARLENRIVIPEDRLAAYQSQAGGPYILAHELAHAQGIEVHCNGGKENLCIKGDLMHSDVQSMGGSLSSRECRILRDHE